MKANEYQVLQTAVDEGVGWGFVRAYKYTEEPTEDQLKEAIKQAVLDAICDWFKLDESDNA